MVGIRLKKFAEFVLNVLSSLGLIVFIYQSISPVSDFIHKALHSDLKEIDKYFSQTTDKPPVNYFEGSFVVNRWPSLCELTSLRRLYRSSLFPNYPDIISLERKLSLRFSQNRRAGIRISGFLKVPESGYYAFRFNSSGMSELWLKTVTNESLHRVLRATGSDQDRTDLSDEIFMELDHIYSFEVFSVSKFFEVKWIVPDSRSFISIESKFIFHKAQNHGTEALLGSSLIKENRTFHNRLNVGRRGYYFVSFIPNWAKSSAIPSCQFLSNRESIRPINHSLDINVNILYQDVDGEKKDLWKNSNQIKTIINVYMDGLEKVYPLKYKVKRLYKLERLNHIASRGPVYMIHLEFVVDGLDYTQRVIEYVYQHNSTSLCQPLHLKWHRDAVINVMVVVKDDETSALRRFIDMIGMVFVKTLEVDFHLIIITYGRVGIDASYLDSKSLKQRFTIVQLEGDYSIPRGLNKAASLAKGKRAVLLTCDVNMYIPDTLFEDTRTHCVQGHMVFSPVYFQLDCGEDPERLDPNGHWSHKSYSVLGMYKTDWDNIGGMDEKLFGHNGEIGFLQKLRKSNLSLARLTYRGMFRYFSSYDSSSHQTSSKQ